MRWMVSKQDKKVVIDNFKHSRRKELFTVAESGVKFPTRWRSGTIKSDGGERRSVNPSNPEQEDS
jgi:hypothetical protein